jgi:hypothetical protein
LLKKVWVLSGDFVNLPALPYPWVLSLVFEKPPSRLEMRFSPGYQCLLFPEADVTRMSSGLPLSARRRHPEHFVPPIDSGQAHR